MKEKDIQKILIERYCDKHKVSVPNVYFYKWESDLLSITKNDEVIEFEIKSSRFDYQNDFKKVEKHNTIKLCRNYSEVPNKFYYVCPEGLIDKSEIPGYAGLIYIKTQGLNKYFWEEIKAPILHGEKINPLRWEEIAIKLFYKLNY